MNLQANKSLLLALAMTISVVVRAQSSYQIQPVSIQTRWAKEVSPSNALKEYPRPQLERSNWTNLNGLWDYAITDKDQPLPEKAEGQILVPYPIESALSGVKKPLLPSQNLWYIKKLALPALKNGERRLLHFGAVDYQATVYVDGQELTRHEGGYTAFSCDITRFGSGAHVISVKVYDPSDQGAGPHGKQVLNPKDIYYTPSSGIWQTVWLETVPEQYITGILLTPDIDRGELRLAIDRNDPSDEKEGLEIEAIALEKDRKVAEWHSNHNSDNNGQQSGVLKLNNPRLWSPSNPFLYDLVVRLKRDGKVVDEVKSYFGMRKISIQKDKDGNDRIALNNQPYYNLGTLDQGFWPDGLYTAPTDEALAFDIKAIKAMGFNTIRKHIKVEPARWYYWADKLGMLVWQDMVNPNQGLPEGAKQAFEQQSAEEVAQLHNYPCITTWVLFNEKWGQYDQERLTKWLKQEDPSRIVNGHTGELLYVNEQLRSPSPNAYVGADMTDVHAYPDPMISIKQEGKARVCGEFGGIGVFIPDHQWITGAAWGYIQEKPAGLQAKYTIMNQHLKLMEREGLSGSIYTQPFDVEGEQNGLMTYDREVIKIPFAALRKIHSQLNPDVNAANWMTGLSGVTAQDADLTEPGIKYSNLLQQYIDGKREPAFLKQLSTAASQAGDKPGAALASGAYIKTLKEPYSKEDLEYIMQVTNSSNEAGFDIIYRNAAQIDKFLGTRQAEVKMMNIIFKDKIQAGVSDPNPNAQPDWNSISNNVSQYGASGEEILLRAKTFHYLNRQDWGNFVPAADAYIKKYGAYISIEELNQWAWTVFEKVNDRGQLLTAAEWSALSMRDGENASLMDTKANLLYKAGRKTEGIALEEKAVALSGNEELKANLAKMKKGE